MVIGIGTDIVEIARIADVLDRQGDAFVQRILTHSEQKQYQASKKKAAFLAKRFAAKEAVAKALGTGIGSGVSFQDMTISNDEKGAPSVSLSAGAAQVAAEKSAQKVLLSIADEQKYAIAYAMLSD
jgi:holo-[acyl-carrier protein] synthase|tara:strand:+ start:330 stop:707 length:378 start_codon:yes stop_codon:yes gene_type:complete